MRLEDEMIEYLANEVVTYLLDKKLIEVDGSRDMVNVTVAEAIKNELGLEDSLNEEVKNLLEAHEKMLDKEGVDYRRMFAMIKNKLARERGIIL